MAAGKIRSIGISNFTIEETQKLLETAKIPPAVNQIEAHPYLLQPDLFKFLKDNVSSTHRLTFPDNIQLINCLIEYSARGVQSARKQYFQPSTVCKHHYLDILHLLINRQCCRRPGGGGNCQEIEQGPRSTADLVGCPARLCCAAQERYSLAYREQLPRYADVAVLFLRISDTSLDFVIPDAEFDALNKLDRNERYNYPFRWGVDVFNELGAAEAERRAEEHAAQLRASA